MGRAAFVTMMGPRRTANVHVKATGNDDALMVVMVVVVMTGWKRRTLLMPVMHAEGTRLGQTRGVLRSNWTQSRYSSNQFYRPLLPSGSERRAGTAEMRAPLNCDLHLAAVAFQRPQCTVRNIEFLPSFQKITSFYAPRVVGMRSSYKLSPFIRTFHEKLSRHCAR